jgi:hypothetical protein
MPAEITPQPSAPVRTCQRGYVRDGQRAGQVQRVHVVREHGPKEQHGTSTLCGQFTGAHRQSQGIFRDAPHELPEGLSWCPTCVGKLAEQTGRTAEVAALLGLLEVPR